MTLHAKNEANAGMTRRHFLKTSGASSLVLTTGVQAASDDKKRLRVGLISDIHYADLDTAGTRHYRDSISKVRVAIEKFNDSSLDMVVCLGDLIDAGKSVKEEYAHLETVYKEFKQLKVPCRFVLGNHCVWTLTKSEFLQGVSQKSSYDAVSIKGVRLVMLDACHRKDGVSYGRQNYGWTDTEIPENQRIWLKRNLADTEQPTLVFVHQRLDVEGNYGIHSAPAVREILETSGQVAAVFQGHNHVNDHQTIQGIHYLTHNAVIEGPAPDNNAYSILEYSPAEQTIRIEGFHNQADYRF
ncbi:MAG: alkaline phosphatase [Verrucomicrobia bacterium]|jgi:predicted phosphodiesterase|nr:alkaline phosphatase [Verrucomicrobiota bacterium]